MPRPIDPTLTVLESRTELTRRQALKLLAGCVAAAQAACIEPPGDQVRPYARLPPELTPGTPRFFATSMLLDGLATGLLVESHEGRPTKIEGNPDHPASLGATLAQHQASVLDLYDPHRARGVTCHGAPASWPELYERLMEAPSPLWLVMPRTSSPLEQSLLAAVRKRHPDAIIVTHGEAAYANRHAGSELAFGRALDQQLDFSQAELVVSLDAELFSRGPMAVRWAHDFAARKRTPRSPDSMTRLYVVEPMLTPTGSMADHRLAVPAGDVVAVTCLLAQALSARGISLPDLSLEQPQRARGGAASPEAQAWVAALADDLVARRGRSLLAVGARQPAACHALALALNVALGNLDTTVRFTEPVLATPPGPTASLPELARALHEGRVGTVVLVDCNPVYGAPPKLALAQALRRAKLSVHFDGYRNETSESCTWQAPLSHYLESWGDARAQDGTHSIVQPLIQPLYDTRSRAEVLALLAGEARPQGYRLLRASLRPPEMDEASFKRYWNRALSTGLVEHSALPSVGVAWAARPDLRSQLRLLSSRREQKADRTVEVALSPSPTLLDERFANNAWLQELPHPRTKQAWGNAALLSPRLAATLQVENGSVVRLSRAQQQLELPVFIVAEHADDCITIELGYGRTSTDEQVARAVGGNGYKLITSPEERILSDVTVRVTSRRERLACTQDDVEQHGRKLAPARTVAELARAPASLADLRSSPPSTLPPTQGSEGPQWAMTIDTSSCNGCSACVIACQSENNIPVVGKQELYRGREMHWLRIDTYLLAGDSKTRNVVNQPMMCQHCEHAPCEYVCPVFATEHSPDGLNEMVYNRCIGTRFCQANCPYKVRRFNWLHYSDDDESLTLQKNPQVTVRDRGVMEKCTYCVQRIRKAEYRARMDKDTIKPSEVVTACQQACPTQAIQFSMLSDRDSAMVRGRESALAYASLHELGTRPRTMYLAKLINPHPSFGERS